MHSYTLAALALLTISCTYACPSKDRILSQIHDCKSMMLKPPTAFDIEYKLEYCMSLNMARDCASNVFRTCTAGTLYMMDLPDDVQGFESEAYTMLVKNRCMWEVHWQTNSFLTIKDKTIMEQKSITNEIMDFYNIWNYGYEEYIYLFLMFRLI